MWQSRFKIGYLILTLMVGWLAVEVVRSTLIDNSPRDLLFAALSKLDGDFTVYAPGYRESNFRAIRIGMTQAEVEAIMGSPLEVSEWQEGAPGQPIEMGVGRLQPRWSYSRSGKRLGNYWRRELFFKDGVVHWLESEFYLD